MFETVTYILSSMKRLTSSCTAANSIIAASPTPKNMILKKSKDSRTPHRFAFSGRAPLYTPAGQDALCVSRTITKTPIVKEKSRAPFSSYIRAVSEDVIASDQDKDSLSYNSDTFNPRMDPCSSKMLMRLPPAMRRIPFESSFLALFLNFVMKLRPSSAVGFAP